ncbi:MAG: hypothetical protein MUO50_01735, partial [Longimicrobiales bacterium]|nr:hypothetical protein [Longimicrobiales bacterium]
ETGEEGEYLAFRHSLRHLSPVVTYRLGPLRTSLGPTFVHARAKVEAPGLGQEKQETLKVGMEVSVGASSALLIPWLQVAVQARYRLVGSPEFGPFEAHDGAVPSFKVGFNHWQVGVGLGLRFEGSGVAGGPSTSDLRPTDVFAELGRGAGKDAAGSRRTLGYSVASILGGLPIGIWAPCSGQSDCRSLVLSGIAVVGITSAVALISSKRVPGELTHAFENEDPRYQEAFNTSYRNELRRRQRRAILRGTLTGAVAGLGLLLVLLPST